MCLSVLLCCRGDAFWLLAVHSCCFSSLICLELAANRPNKADVWIQSRNSTPPPVPSCALGADCCLLRSLWPPSFQDSTLVVRKSNSQFARDAADWRWFNKSVPKKLIELLEDEYKLVIFT